MSRVLAIDIGGTNIRAGLADIARPHEVEMVATGAAPSDLLDFRTCVNGLIETYRPDRIGIAIPGLANGTLCRWVPNLPYLDGTDVADLFPQQPMALGNDAQMALVAEATAGAAAGFSDAILIAIGTGIGSAVLSGGRVLRGSRGGATSFGWASADPTDRGDDRDGWLERHASGRALDRLACAAGLKDGTALIAAARTGDADSLARLGGPASALAACLAGAIALLDPAVVLITGGVASAFDVLAPLTLTALTRQLPPHLRSIRLAVGHFGPGAVIAGAAITAAGSPLWESQS
ncbi:MAG: ROK family protein [Ancalomicrobiaceae bacterium]|nr:ROK family protein [Ancalomicrobiaceae bacterium]